MAEENTLLAPAEGYYTEKKSEFFALLAPADTKEAVSLLLEEERKKHPDARHYCYAYRFFDGSERAADDGEPKGTAGQPMLEVLRKCELKGVAVIVTREFGGILLGASGLQRAYRAAAADAVANARPFAEIVACRVISFEVDYSLYTPVRRLLDNFVCRLPEEPIFAEAVTVTVSLAKVEADHLLASLTELSQGRMKLISDEERLEFLPREE